MAETVVGIFDTHEHAIRGVEQLRHEGFRADQISLFVPDRREAEGYSDEVGVRVIQAGAAGLAAGGLVGGLSAWLLGITGLLVPGAGLILAAGPVAAAVLGAVGGASVGGFVGMLAGLGLPHHAAEQYTQALQEGRTVVFVHPEGMAPVAEAALGHAHARGIHRYEDRIGQAALRDAGAAAVPGTAANPVERAAPDRTLDPSDVASAIEGQQVTQHTQYLDEADLRTRGGDVTT